MGDVELFVNTQASTFVSYVRKHEAEERNEPVQSLKLRPGFGVKDGVFVLLLNLGQEPPSRSTICDVISGRTAFVVARVELANDVSFAVLHMPDERAPVSFSSEDFDSLLPEL